MKKSLLMCSFLVIISYILGYAIIYYLLEDIEQMHDFLLMGIWDNQELTIRYLILNNLFMCLLFAVGSGIITTPLLLYQGAILGTQFGMWIRLGFSKYTYILLMLPHGIVELPGMIISGAIGFKLLTYIRRYLKDRENIKKSEVLILVKYFFVCILLIVIGAVIEKYITPYIFEEVFNNEIRY